MPINEKMMKSMEKKYGKEKAADVYYAVEQKNKTRTGTSKVGKELPKRGQRTAKNKAKK